MRLALFLVAFLAATPALAQVERVDGEESEIAGLRAEIATLKAVSCCCKSNWFCREWDK